MVRPNQIISSNIQEGKLTFIMFARSEEQVKRRVLLLNFPGRAVGKLLRGDDINKAIEDVNLMTEGRVNRYAVTVNTRML